MKALQIAATGMAAQQARVDVISNNLANVSTTGFNPRRVDFVDLGYQQIETPGSISSSNGAIVPTGIQVGMGVEISSVSVLSSQGSLEQTGGELDLAIEGLGFIEVALPNGTTGYTRDGSFKLSPDGLIVNSQGHEIGGGITIPDDATSITITDEGEVFANFANRTDPESLGQILLATFTNEKGLKAIGENIFVGTFASGDATEGVPGEEGFGFLRQGYLEASSVDSVKEITELIKAQRAYELNSKVISAADQILSVTTQVR